MTDDYTDDQEQQPDPLTRFEGLFKTPTGQAFAQEARIRIADYAQKKEIAEANTAAGQAFTNNLGEMRSNFIGMVKDDPASTHLALDLAHLGTSVMVGTVPGVDPAQIEGISTGMQRDIARTAVTSLADQHEGQARDMLDHPRIAGLLGDEKDSLSGYITGQATARAIDAVGAQRMAQQAAVQRADQSAWGYMAAMVDPDTGELSHPPGWAERVMADPTMPPHYKAGLFDTYGKLQQNGDAPVSDPYSVHDAVRSIAAGGAEPSSFIVQAGDDLRTADAVYLAKLAGDPSQRGRAGQLANALDMGRQQLASPENGPAGQLAFQGFSSSMLSAARAGADLDPTSKTYALAGNAMQQFAPKPADMAGPVLARPPADRTPLDKIFGGTR